MKPSKTYLRQEMRRYLLTVPDATPEEIADLKAWVEAGNDPYCNPSHIADGGGWEIMKHIAGHPDESCRVPTWRKMIKTSYGIINHQPWNEELFRHIDRKMVKTVEKIAYINLSKMPGDKRSVDSKLKKNYSLWRNILFEQIEAYDPQIIIFGNTFKFFKEDMIGLDIEPIKIGGYLDIYERNGVLLFDAYHPSSSKFSNDCIKTIIEISLKRYC